MNRQFTRVSRLAGACVLWHGQDYPSLFLFLSLSSWSPFLFFSPVKAFFYHSRFLRSREKGAKDLGKKPKRNCQWSMAARRWPKKSVILRRGKCLGVENFRWRDFHERLPLHETRGWSIRECRWHRLDASIVLRRLPRNYRHSSWLKFILHCVHISSSTLLNETEFKVSFWRTIAAAWRFFRVGYLFFFPPEGAIWLSNPEGDDFGAKNCPAIASGGYLKGAYNASRHLRLPRQ